MKWCFIFSYKCDVFNMFVVGPRLTVGWAGRFLLLPSPLLNSLFVFKTFSQWKERNAILFTNI